MQQYNLSRRYEACTSPCNLCLNSSVVSTHISILSARDLPVPPAHDGISMCRWPLALWLYGSYHALHLNCPLSQLSLVAVQSGKNMVLFCTVNMCIKRVEKIMMEFCELSRHRVHQSSSRIRCMTISSGKRAPPVTRTKQRAWGKTRKLGLLNTQRLDYIIKRIFLAGLVHLVKALWRDSESPI